MILAHFQFSTYFLVGSTAILGIGYLNQIPLHFICIGYFNQIPYPFRHFPFPAYISVGSPAILGIGYLNQIPTHFMHERFWLKPVSQLFPINVSPILACSQYFNLNSHFIK